MLGPVTAVRPPVAVTFLPSEAPARQARAMPVRDIAGPMGIRFTCHPIEGRARLAVAMQAQDTVEDDDLAWKAGTLPDPRNDQLSRGVGSGEG